MYMKLPKFIRDFYNQIIPPQDEEKEDQADTVKQIEFGYVIITILVYLLIFLLIQENFLGKFF